MNTREKLDDLFRDSKHGPFESEKYHAGMFAIAYAIHDLAQAIREVNKPEDPSEFIGEEL